MPNHVINEVVFENVDASAQARILSSTVNDKGEIDFSVLLPLPLNMWWGNVGQDHERAFKQTSLDWCRANWGTKWNAYDHRPVEQTDDSLTLCFETAWTAPYPWLAAVFNHTGIGFRHRHLSEGGSPARVGVFTPDDGTIMGPRWTEADADETTARHLHKLLWGAEEFAEDDL